ncbi:DNA glycosylase AlkZ-like family protein, partial [Vibrio sp. 10N.222.49.C9]
ISQLFDFDYQLECYVPAAKRKFGYFCLPIAWDGKLIGRADCRVEKSTSTLQVTNLYIEKAFTHRDGFDGALAKELHAFATFNQCTSYQ